MSSLELLALLDDHAAVGFVTAAAVLMALYVFQGRSERQQIRAHAEEIEAHNALVPTGPGLRLVPQFQQVVIRPTPGRALRLTRQTVGYRYYIDGQEVSHATAVAHGADLAYNPRKD